MVVVVMMCVCAGGGRHYILKCENWLGRQHESRLVPTFLCLSADLDSSCGLALDLFAERYLPCLEVIHTLSGVHLPLRHRSPLDVPEVHILSIAMKVVLDCKAELCAFALYPIVGQVPAPDGRVVCETTPYFKRRLRNQSLAAKGTWG